MLTLQINSLCNFFKMEKVDWKVEGMTCSTCALSVTNYLKKQGLHSIKVSIASGEVSFESDDQIEAAKLIKGIDQLGYSVSSEKKLIERKHFLHTPLQKFYSCLPFTLLLMLHMLPFHVHFLMIPLVQLFLCLPVFIIGMEYFGKSAFYSIRNGVPNMNVLIAIGAISAFAYSVINLVVNFNEPHFYFESAATIITVVFLGYWMEERSIAATQLQLKKLAVEQKVTARMIAFDDQHKEQIFTIDNEQLRNGDLILINEGDKVPADCKILWGNCLVNESLLTGEAAPINKNVRDQLIGGSILDSGSVKAQVTAAGNDTVLSKIIRMAKDAQSDKPPIQRLADKISAIFVPVVLILAILTFLLNNFLLHLPLDISLMRCIAVLVIACPCAMGLATPAAIAVGLGRAAKNGILFKDAGTLELFKGIRQIVFDKTGTLTTGKFKISGFHFENIAETEFKMICGSLEKHSGHPMAKTITDDWKKAGIIYFTEIKEDKGFGIRAADKEGNKYSIGSFAMVKNQQIEQGHNMYVYKNDQFIGWIDMIDEIREESFSVIQYFKSKGIRTIMISGDNISKCQHLADKLGMDVYYAEKTPQEKLSLINDLSAGTPTAMIGDGINDAAALAAATIGCSIGDASELARHHSQVILINHGIKYLPLSFALGRHTYLTIKQNLFWAFFYNIIAIPVAGLGFLNPGIAALAMGFSDVMLAINSLRLKWKKVVA